MVWKNKFKKGFKKIAKNLPTVIGREASAIAGKPLPKKLKHRKVSGYKANFGQGIFK